MRLLRYTIEGECGIGVSTDGGNSYVSLSDWEQLNGRPPLDDRRSPPRDGLIEWLWRHQESNLSEVELSIRKTIERRDIDVNDLDQGNLLSPVQCCEKIIAAGNFKDHLTEVTSSKRLPEHLCEALETTPGVKTFLKGVNCLTGPHADIAYPGSTSELDYEVELAIVIHRLGRDIDEHDAGRHVLGVTVANDLSARDVQIREMMTGMIDRGKNLDGLLPLGPWIETDWRQLQGGRIRTKVNGEVRQLDSLAKMSRGIAELVAAASVERTLRPGDVILAGTPPGPAGFQSNRETLLLKRGDVVECDIEGIGALRNRIV